MRGLLFAGIGVIACLPLPAFGQAPSIAEQSSAAADLTVAAAPPSSLTQNAYLVDPTFHPSLPGVPSVVAAQSDGKVLAAGPFSFSVNGAAQYGLVRLNIDGSFDTSYIVNPDPFDGSQYLDGISVQADGSSIVTYQNPSTFAQVAAEVAATGVWNSAYAPPPGVPLASGGWVKFSLSAQGGNNVLTVSVLNPDQSVANSYQVTLAPPYSSPSSPTFSNLTTAFDSQGRLYVAAVSFQGGGTGHFGTDASVILRLLPDGSLDPGYSPATLNGESVETLLPGLDGNTLYYESVIGVEDVSVKFNRLLSDGSPDSSYSPVVLFDGYFGYEATVNTFGTNPDGSYLVSSPSMVNGTTASVVRYDSNGVLDPTFVMQLQSPSFKTGEPALTLLESLSDGRILVGGNFTTLNGSAASYLARLYPTTLLSPAPSSVTCGSNVTLSANSSAPSPSYQWEFNGAAIAGANGPNLTLSNIGTEQAGSYSVSITSGTSTFTTQAAAVTVTNEAWLTNLSARAYVAPTLGAADVLIAGFTIAGPTQKSVLVRGPGPGLQNFGVTDFLSNPSLGIYTSPSTQIGSTVTGWNSDLSGLFSALGAFPFAANSHDTAVVNTFSPGSYTAVVNSADGQDGVALAELYDADQEAPSTRLVNLSARAFVGTGSNILIGGFVIEGTSSETVLVRAIGPGLSLFGLASGALARPLLQVYDTNPSGAEGSPRLVASVQGWDLSPTAGNSTVQAGMQPATAAEMNSVGAFGLTSGSADSAMVLTLPPGGYTAQVSGADGGTGVALVEIYEMP